ncbi:MAG: glycosyltransferase family 4 protein [Actinobacteria bacterium]|nr:glycosyltransferase family 4 protein [Actinomycetota bacterium]
MRIAIVSPYSWKHPGGVNNHIRGLSGQLIKLGHEVAVMAPDGSGKADGASVVETRWGDCPVFSAGRSFAIPANGSIANLALVPGTGRRVRAFLREGRFDVVHVHEPLVPLVSTAALGGTGYRLVATFHAASEGQDLLYRVARLRYGRLFENIDCRVAVSLSAKKVIAGYFPGEYRIVPNGVEESRFSGFVGTGKKELWRNETLILFVGRDEPRKGLPVLLEAFETVVKKMPGCRLLLAGSSIEEERVFPKLSPELRRKVTVLGHVSDEELPAYYAMSDVFCAPALGGESFGIILLEAMAAGTPVVASDIDGYRDVVESTGGGILFENGNARHLSCKLMEVLADREFRGRLASDGRNGVKRYSWDRVALEIESCYRS